MQKNFSINGVHIREMDDEKLANIIKEEAEEIQYKIANLLMKIIKNLIIN